MTPSSAAAAEDGKKLTVMIVDDDPALRRTVMRQVTELGYRAIEAEDGPSALLILNGETVDLLFTDVIMPGGLSGYDLARLVLSRWPRMKGLITSGSPETKMPDDDSVSSRLRFLPKPYRKPELAKTLQEVLAG